MLRVQITHEQDFTILESSIAHRLNLFFGGIDDVRHRLVAGHLVEMESAAVEDALGKVLCDLKSVGRVGMAEYEIVNVLK
jgi:hypothetical protein